MDNLGYSVNKSPEYTFDRATRDLICNTEVIDDIDIEFTHSTDGVITYQANHGFIVGDIITDGLLFEKVSSDIANDENFEGYKVTKVLDENTFVSEEI